MKESFERAGPQAFFEEELKVAKKAAALPSLRGLDDKDAALTEAQLQSTIDKHSPKSKVAPCSWRSCETDGEILQLLEAEEETDAFLIPPADAAADFSIVTVGGNLRTTPREWMAHEGPQHLVLGQELRFRQEGREAGTHGLALRFLAREAQKAKSKS